MSKQIEEWRPIEGFEGLYEVSDWGRVRSLDRTVEYNDGRIKHHKGKILKIAEVVMFNDGRKYGKVQLYKNKNGKMYNVHRLVAQTFIPNPNNYPIVNHKNRIENT